MAVNSRLLPDLPNNPAKTNWVEKAGGLPDYVQRVAKHIFWGGGHYTEDHAIAAAVQIMYRRAAKGNKDAIAGVAEWERKRMGTKVKTKLSVSPEYRSAAPTTPSNTNKAGYPIKPGDKQKLASAIKLYKMHKHKYSPAKRKAIKAHIMNAAKKSGVKVALAIPVVGPANQRQFTEAKHRRMGGKFAPTGNANAAQAKPSPNPQSARDLISALKVGSLWNIPGIDGSIKRTDSGFVVRGPNGFSTTASTVDSAMAVAAKLLQDKKGGKK